MTALPPLRALAAALAGDVSGNSVLAPGPGHSKRDRSLSVTPSARAPSGFLVHSFAGDDPIDCLDHIRERLGLPPSRPGLPQKRALGARQCAPGHGHSAALVKAVTPPPDNAARALNIWRQAVDPRGTIVEQYLKSRGLELPDEAANEAVRFFPDCRFGSEHFPAMVCLVRNIVTNEPQAVHRTALAPDGTAIKRNSKTFRMSLGPVSSGATKLDPDEDIAQGLCIGEGVETCLSGRQMGLRPVWSAVSTGGVKSCPVLPGVDGLHIFKENDANGTSAEAFEECARRWYDAGRNVVIVEPDTAKDLNDELREAAR
jgi:putative DNA primase/helicase